MCENVGLDRPARLAQLLPVGHLGDDSRALVPDRRGGLVQVGPELPVGERLAARPRGTAGSSRSLSLRRRGSRPGAARAPALAHARAGRRSGAGTSRRRPCRPRRRWRRSPGTCRSPSRSRCRRSSPRRCRRTRSTRSHLEAPTSSRPADCAEQSQRRVPDARDAQRVAGRVVGDAVGERRTDVGRPEPVHEQLRELEDARGE